MKLTQPGRSPLGSLVYRFMGAMHRYDGGRSLPVLHAAKVTAPQLAVLEFTREPQNVSAVASHLGLSLPATSQMVEKLVGSRLVRRVESKQDRRERKISLSAKGKALVDRLAAARAARFDASLSDLPPFLAARFESILTEVVDTLNQADPQPQQNRRSLKRSFDR